MIAFTKSHHLIHWWKGTDTLKLVMYPPTLQKTWYVRIFLERILFKIIEPLFREHWVDHECLAGDLIKFGIKADKISLRYDPVWDDVTINKRKHSKFVVTYFEYHGGNKYFKDWLYGRDYIQEAINNFKKHKDIKFRPITNKMSKQRILDILAVTDLYIRPNRHDGNSRLAQFCKICKIPTYHSRYDRDPIHLFRSIEHEYQTYLTNDTVR